MEARALADLARHNKEKKEEKKSRSKRKDHTEIMGLFSRGLLFHTKFIREPKDWKSKSFNIDKQKRDFINWVYCKYPVPKFMYKAFTLDVPHGVHKHVIWFLTIAQGGSFAKKVKGILTKREAHMFLRAPDNNTIEENLWWARCEMMEIPPSLTHAIVKRFFANVPIDDKFWNSLLHLIKKEEKIINVSALSDVMDFLRWQHRANARWSLKGRTLGSLIKLSNEWHREMQLRKFGNGNLTWTGSDIPDWRFKNKATKTVWHVTQLLSSKELYNEGRRMKHCVASYGHRCVDGLSAIFTMTSNDGVNVDEKHLTIEITKEKRMVQARGRFNKPPAGEARLILNKWRNVHNIQDGLGYGYY
jgi:hypothetical protein